MQDINSKKPTPNVNGPLDFGSFLRFLGRAALATMDIPLRYIWGRDLFISYSRRDSRKYTPGLVLAVQQRMPKLSVYLDRWVAPPSGNLPLSLRLHLRWSSMLVVVCTENAVRSSFVKDEVASFARLGRKVVMVDVDGAYSAVRDQDPWMKVSGADPEFESGDTMQSGVPSQNVVERIEKSLEITTQDRRLRRAVWGTLAFVVLSVGITAIYSYLTVSVANAKGADATQRATQAELAEGTANKNASAAAQVAREQTDIADAAKQRADAETKEAEKQAKIAAGAGIRASALQQESEARQLVLDANQIRAEQPAKLPTSVLLATEAARRLSDLNVERGTAVRALGEGLSILRPIEWTTRLTGEVRDIRMLPDGDHGLVITTDDSVYLLDFRQPSSKGVTLIASAPVVATPNADGTAVVVVGHAATGVWRLPERQFIKLDNAPRATEAMLSPDATVVALAGDTPELWIWRPNEPTKPAERFDLGEFRIRDMVFAGSSPSLIAVSSTPASLYVPRNHRVWMLDAGAGKMRFFDVNHAVSRIWSDSSGKEMILVGQEPRGRGRGGTRHPVEVWRWNVTESLQDPSSQDPSSEDESGELASMDGIHIFESEIFTFNTFSDIVFDNGESFVGIVGDGRMQLVDPNDKAIPFGPMDLSTTGAVVKGYQAMTFNADNTARLYYLPPETDARLYYRQSELARFTHDQPITAGVIDSDHNRAITGSADGVVKVWGLTHPIIAETREIKNDSTWLLSGDATIAATDNGGSFDLWETASMDQIGTIRPSQGEHFNEAQSLSQDGRFFAGAGHITYDSIPKTSISLYETRSGSAVQQPIQVDGFVTNVRPANGIVLSRVYQSPNLPARLAVWNARTSSLTWPYGRAIDPDATDRSQDVLLADDGTAAAVQFRNGRLGLWTQDRQLIVNTSVGSQERLSLFGGLNGVLVTAPRMIDDPDSAFPIQGAGVARVRKGDSLKTIATFSVRKGEELRAVGPNSHYIVTHPEDYLLRVVDSYSGKDLLNIMSNSTFDKEAFSSDSKYFAVSDNDYVIRVFDTVTWRLIAYVPTEGGGNDIMWLGTPLRLVTRSYGHVTSWRWRFPNLLAAACMNLKRCLSPAECEQYFAGKQCPAICSYATRK